MVKPVRPLSDVEPAPTAGASEPDLAWKASEVVEPVPAIERMRLVTARSHGARSQKSGMSCSGTGP